MMTLKAAADTPKPQPVQLQRATDADAEALAALYQTAWADADESSETARATMRAWLEQGGALFFSCAGRPVCALRWRETPYGWEVGRVATLPDYRGQSLGRWLTTRLEALAIQRSVPELELTLAPTQTDLLPYYTRMGYRPRSAETPLTLYKRVGGVWQRQG